jgi:tRNA dimethylallyltransferase
MKKSKLYKIIVIVGPTASGKSDLAVKIAKRFNGEIVSADSRQIYRGMDIGTAKPRKSQKPKAKSQKYNSESKTYISEGIPHHLIDIKNPNEDYSAGQYKKDATRAINKIIKSGKLPILVGGTGLYVDAIVKNLEFPRVKENKKLRARLEREIKKKGLAYVFKKLVDLDPEAAYIVDPKNPRRVIRALEVAMLSGKKFSEQRKTGQPPYNALEIGINILPEILRRRITGRIEQMVKNGLIGEVKKLVEKYGPNCKALDAIGYREIVDYLERKISLAEAAEQINKNTRHYARRQMTWFKRNPQLHWIKNQRKALIPIRRFIG